MSIIKWPLCKFSKVQKWLLLLFSDRKYQVLLLCLRVCQIGSANQYLDVNSHSIPKQLGKLIELLFFFKIKTCSFVCLFVTDKKDVVV